MNINTGEIKEFRDLTDLDLESKDWKEISKAKSKFLEDYEIRNKRVDLGARSPLSNQARNARKKKKKMSQKSKVKNRSK